MTHSQRIRTYLPRTVFAVCLIFLLTLASAGRSQVTVCDCREFTVDARYTEVLERLEGENPSREMFASQEVFLTRFEMRKQPEEAAADLPKGVVRALFDIRGESDEFGCMEFLMQVQASEERAGIDVFLTQPVDMLLGQHYHFEITPLGKEQTRIRIQHQLDVSLTCRRLPVVNRIIESVTRTKAGEQVVELTGKMSDAVAGLALRKKPAAGNKGTGNRNADPKTADPKPERTADPEKEDKDDQQPALTEETAGGADSQDDNGDGNNGTLTVTITGVDPAGGEVRIAIFDNAAQFRAHDARKDESQQGSVFRSEAVRNDGSGRVVHRFTGLPFGTYAIAAFQDQDGNSKLNSSLLGMPSEPYGFSRNARGTFGPPDFTDATIEFSAGKEAVEFAIE